MHIRAELLTVLNHMWYFRDYLSVGWSCPIHLYEGLQGVELWLITALMTIYSFTKDGIISVTDLSFYWIWVTWAVLESGCKISRRHTILCRMQWTFCYVVVGIQYRWVDCYFPFTHPSWELEIFYNNSWFEVLGSGLLEQEILQNGEWLLRPLLSVFCK